MIIRSQSYLGQDLDISASNPGLEGRERFLVPDLADKGQVGEGRAPLSLDLAGLQVKGGVVGGADDALVGDLALEHGSLRPKEGGGREVRGNTGAKGQVGG